MYYWINKLLYDMNPELYERLKSKDDSVFAEYPLTNVEQQALRRAVDERAFKTMSELGVLPVLLFTFARLMGCSVSEYPELLKK
jgi:hypothetical protein